MDAFFPIVIVVFILAILYMFFYRAILFHKLKELEKTNVEISVGVFRILTNPVKTIRGMLPLPVKVNSNSTSLQQELAKKSNSYLKWIFYSLLLFLLITVIVILYVKVN